MSEATAKLAYEAKAKACGWSINWDEKPIEQKMEWMAVADAVEADTIRRVVEILEAEVEETNDGSDMQLLLIGLIEDVKDLGTMVRS